MDDCIKEIAKTLQSFVEPCCLDSYLVVVLSEQELWLVKQGKVVASYPVSTASKGAGSEQDSGKTPLGVHCVAEKIGGGAEPGTLFKARTNTHRKVPVLSRQGEYSRVDAITSRILWLKGLEPGKNKGSNKQGIVDSYQRYIYIHGTNEEWRLGKPASHGCIRMSNSAVIDLYDKVPVDTLLVIIETTNASNRPNKNNQSNKQSNKQSIAPKNLSNNT